MSRAATAGTCLILAIPCVPPGRADHPTASLIDSGVGAVTTVGGATAPEGSRSVSFQWQYIPQDELSDLDLTHAAEEGRDVHSTESLSSISLRGAYAPTDRLTLGFSLPYVTRRGLKEAHHDDGHGDGAAGEEEERHEGGKEGVEFLGNSSGIGDLSLFGQVGLVSDPESGLSASILAGVRTPTGSTSERADNGERFETEHQPGSGSWDGFVGAAGTWRLGEFAVDANVLYTIVSSGAQDTDLGEIFNYNVALSRRGWTGRADHEDHDGHRHDHVVDRLSLLLELNGDWRDNARVAGVAQPNTGGHVLYLAPGIRGVLSGGWSCSVSVGIPLVVDLNGTQSEPTLRLLAGVARSM